MHKVRLKIDLGDNIIKLEIQSTFSTKIL